MNKLISIGLPRLDFACFEHSGGNNTKGEYVVLVCQKHYLPIQLAHVLTVFYKLVAAHLYRSVFLMYAHVRVL